MMGFCTNLLEGRRSCRPALHSFSLGPNYMHVGIISLVNNGTLIILVFKLEFNINVDQYLPTLIMMGLYEKFNGNVQYVWV